MEIFLFLLANGIILQVLRAVFRFSSSSNTKKKKRRQGTQYLPPPDAPARWFGGEERPSIQDYVIPGLVYYGGKLLDYTGTNDPCLINPHLELSKNEESGFISMKNVSYSALSPQKRATYLQWLSEGRDNPECDPAFVLLFFYGLERRLFVDGPRGRVTSGERKTIVLEVLRLLQIYGEISYLRHYFLSFLAMEWGVYGDREEVPLYLDIPDIIGKDIFPAIVARLADRGLPLPGETAFQWLIHCPKIKVLPVAQSHPELFRQLFLLRYSQKFEKGIFLHCGRTPLILEYRGANPSLGGRLKIRVSDLQNPFVVRAPLQKITVLGVACAEELEPYSISAARALLAPELLAFLPEGEDIRLHLSSLCSSGPALVRLRLLEILGYETSTEGQGGYCRLREKIASLGFNLVPENGTAALALCEDPAVVLYEGATILEPSEEYHLLAALLRLGALVAQALGNVSPAKEEVFRALIRGNNNLSKEEKEPLQALLLWAFRTPQSARQIRAVLKDFGEEGQGAMSRVLLTVATADGAISKEEMLQLEKLFTYLGLEKKRLPSDAPHLASAGEPPGGEAGEKQALLSIERELILLRQDKNVQVQKILTGIGLYDAKLPSHEQAP